MAPTTTMSKSVPGCPQVSSSAPTAQEDFVNAIEANDTQYLAQQSMTIPKAELGPLQFRVRCSFNQLNTVTGRETPNLRNGDSTFLPSGSPVYSEKGWPPTCRLAAPTKNETWEVYFALAKGASVATVDPCATHQ